MAFWNSRDDDDAATDAAADELESAATGLPPSEPAPERRGGFYASPIGLVAAAVAVILALLLFAPMHGPETGTWFSRPEPWVPRGDAVYASQRLADIRAEQEIADARAAAWEDVPAVDAHVGSFAPLTPRR